MSSDEEQEGAGRRGGRMAFTDQVRMDYILLSLHTKKHWGSLHHRGIHPAGTAQCSRFKVADKAMRSSGRCHRILSRDCTEYGSSRTLSANHLTAHVQL